MTLLTDDQPIALYQETVRRLRDALDRADFTEQRLREHLRVDSVLDLHLNSWELPLVLYRTRTGGPLDTLVRLFVCDGTVDTASAREAIQPATLEECVGAGVLRVAGNSVNAAVGLIPCQGVIIACDQMWHLREAANSVMGLGPTTLLLAQLTVRRPVSSTLDLCTGSGFQALQAAAHSQYVLGVDSNRRAINLARFNVQLNSVSNVHLLEGNLLEPGLEQKFDLVVANPPFVISPENRFVLRDSGMPRDRLTEYVVRGVGPLLNEGGFAHILCNWAHLAGQDCRERLATWLSQSGCDAWVLRFKTDDPAHYAREWLAQTEESAAEFARRFQAWMDYYERERIEAISYGMITLRRASGRSNWFRYDRAPPQSGPCGQSIERGFALSDFLQSLQGDAALLDARLSRAPELHWLNEHEPDSHGWAPLEARLELVDGLAWMRTVNRSVLELVTRCRGEQPLGHILMDLTSLHGLDLATAAKVYLPVVRRLLEQGFLLPPHVRSAVG